MNNLIWYRKITTLKELLNTTKEDIETLPNIGKKSLKTIEETLKNMGYHWPPK